MKGRITKSFKICRIFGIDIKIHPSWFIVFFWITFSFATGVLPNKEEISGQPNLVYWILSVILTLSLFASVLFHELAHSFMARRLGISVKQITLFILGGVAEIENDPKTAKQELLIAIAGPLSSIFLSVTFFILAMLVQGFGAVSAMIELSFIYLAVVNFVLAIFNLLPGYPMDGGRILRSLLWEISKNKLKATKIASNTGQVTACVLIGFGIFSSYGGVWITIVGFFLLFIAKVEHEQCKQSALDNFLNEAKEHSEEIFKENKKKKIVCKAGDDMEDVLREMRKGNRNWYFIEKDGKIVNVITASQIIKYLKKSKRKRL